MTTAELRKLCDDLADELNGDVEWQEDGKLEREIRDAPDAHDTKGVLTSIAKGLETRAKRIREFADALPDDLTERWK